MQLHNFSFTLILLGNKSVECEETAIKYSSCNLVQYGIISSLLFLVVKSFPLTKNVNSMGARVLRLVVADGPLHIQPLAQVETN